MIEVLEYNNSMKDQIEDFRIKTFSEGNDSISYEKYDPDTNGKTWCVFIDQELASISVVEPSFYTGDPEIAVRVCRYHILKKYRHSHCGFRMLESQIKWARNNNYKIFYLTHNIHNKPLNALYQHKKRMIDKEAKQWFDANWFKELTLDKRWLFRVSNKSDFLQYVYYIDLQKENYIWTPKKNAVWFNHNGNINIKNSEILNGSVQ
jgi:GNAT superfamily N-acetyltransferase